MHKSRHTETVLIQPFTRGFGGKMFSQMMLSDPASKAGRYDDLCGPDIGKVMSALDWDFGDAPVCVTLSDIDGQPIASGFCAPIRLKQSAYVARQFCGMNLSYVVHSKFEGRGYGLAASCLAIQGAASLWNDHLTGKAFLNIQTRAANVKSNSLINHLRGDAPYKEAGFSIQLRPHEVLQYSGARLTWTDALSNAEAHLLNMPFLNEIKNEVEIDAGNELEPELAPAG